MHEVRERGARGSRCLCGYPARPHLAGKDESPKPLDAGRIGVPGDAGPSWPESTGPTVTHYPQTKHFTT
jgi:hypothetical protein